MEHELNQLKFCPKPFEYADLHLVDDELRIYLCCPTWLPHSIGDLKKNSFTDVWNSEVAIKIRESMLNGSFEHCNKSLCPEILSNSIHDRRFIYKKSFRNYLKQKGGKLSSGPKVINFSEDKSCNLTCPSCRKSSFKLSENIENSLIEIRNKILPTLLKEAELVLVCSAGDPFASKFYRDFLFNLDGALYPKLKIKINSNGTLFNEGVFQKMSKIHNNISEVCISVDAASPETYAIVRRGGDYKTLIRNLSFLSNARKRGIVKWLQLDFVVQDHNYEEMGKFVSEGKRLGVDRVYFQRISNWGTFSEEEFQARDICNHSHPNHQQFISMLNNDKIFRDPIIKRGNIAPYFPPSYKQRALKVLKHLIFLRYLRRILLQPFSLL